LDRAVAIIPARAGSKGIPNKNLLRIGGKPLVTWSIEQAQAAGRIESVWVSSDGEDILELARSLGVETIRRPAELSSDTASSESAWLHALDEIEERTGAVDAVVGMQATSPIREADDLDRALAQFEEEELDSLLSVVEIRDFFIWAQKPGDPPESVNYDYRRRLPRQQIAQRCLENGSFYVFTPELLRREGNRLGGKIGLFQMARHKMFQIDEPEDVTLCEIILRGYGLAP